LRSQHWVYQSSVSAGVVGRCSSSLVVYHGLAITTLDLLVLSVNWSRWAVLIIMGGYLCSWDHNTGSTSPQCQLESMGGAHRHWRSTMLLRSQHWVYQSSVSAGVAGRCSLSWAVYHALAITTLGLPVLRVSWSRWAALIIIGGLPCSCDYNTGSTSPQSQLESLGGAHHHRRFTMLLRSQHWIYQSSVSAGVAGRRSSSWAVYHALEITTLDLPVLRVSFSRWAALIVMGGLPCY